MSLSAITSVASFSPTVELQKVAAPAPQPAPTPSPAPADTVSLSSAAQKPVAAHDGDQDGH